MSLIHKVSDLFKERKGSTSIHPSWKIIELKKACEIQNGFAFQSSEFNSLEGIPLIRIRDILKHNPETFFRGSFNDFYIVRKGDLLVGMDGDFNHSLWKGPDSLLNQRVCRIIPNQKILLKRFLYYGLGDYLKKINENTSSTTVKHLSSKSIGEIPFALPPLPEQQRIVAKLDAVFGHLDRLREKLDRIPELLKNFRQQMLTQAVMGELTREWRSAKDLGEWEDKSIDQLAEVISGFAFKSVDFTDQGFQVIRMGNLYNNKLDLSRNPIFLPTSFDPKIIERYTIKKGDVLLSMTGTKYKKDYGFAIEVRENGNLLLNQRIVALRPKINSTFLMYLLQNEIFRDQFFSFETGGNNQGNVGVTSLKSIELQIPSSYEQEEIVKRVDAFFGLADKIESQYQSLKVKIDQMPQAILAKAFRGELVGQEVKEYVREVGELGMVAEGAVDYGKPVNE